MTDLAALIATLLRPGRWMTVHDLRVRAKARKHRLPGPNEIGNAMEELRKNGLVTSEKASGEVMCYFLIPERVAEIAGRKT